MTPVSLGLHHSCPQQSLFSRTAHSLLAEYFHDVHAGRKIGLPSLSSLSPPPRAVDNGKSRFSPHWGECYCRAMLLWKNIVQIFPIFINTCIFSHLLGSGENRLSTLCTPRRTQETMYVVYPLSLLPPRTHDPAYTSRMLCSRKTVKSSPHHREHSGINTTAVAAAQELRSSRRCPEAHLTTLSHDWSIDDAH